MADTGSELHGITVSSFASISLTPPIVMVSIGNNSSLTDGLLGMEHFCVSILRFGQEWIARRFAEAIPSSLKFRDVRLTASASGAPRLTDCLGWIDCVLHQSLAVSTHTLMFGRVIDAGVSDTNDSPLLYYNRRFRSLR